MTTPEDDTLPDAALIVPDTADVPVDDSAEPEDANADHDGPDDYEVNQ